MPESNITLTSHLAALHFTIASLFVCNIQEELRAFFEDVMNSTAATCAPGSSIASCKISSDKTYAFLEMRSVEEASNAMAFDGIVFKDVHLKVRRRLLPAAASCC